MDLLRHWRRRLLGAAGAAVIAPLAVVLAALAVGVGGGGIGSLGALGQAFAGPQLPAAAGLPAGGGRDAADEAGRLLARVQRDRARAPRPAAAPQSTAPSAPTRRTATRPGRTGTINTPRRPGTTPRPASPAPTANPQPSTAPTPTPTPPPSTIHQVGNQVHEVTDPVPVVGPPAGQVVDLIVDTADQLPLP
jgi:hypothetical protein